jgi:hypothetical protein
MSRLTPLDIAQYALRFGFIPIPLRDKVPLVARWQKITSEVALAYIKGLIDADNVGILTGAPSRIVVLDIDGETGIATWQHLLRQHNGGKPIDTFTVRTGSGGFHVYFNYDQRVEGLRNMKRLLPGLDYKTNGGQVVFVGSKTKDVYAITNGYNVETQTITKLVDMPDWLLQILYNYQNSLKR